MASSENAASSNASSDSNKMSDSKTSSKTHREASYPDPFVVPARAEHRQTLILLHGRGSNGEMFGRELLMGRISRVNAEGQSPATLRTAFPNMKFVFPTARRRRARWYNRATIDQWFDNVPIDEQDSHGVSREEEEWQIEGLRQSRQFLKEIVDEEVELLGAQNVFIGGLSQGCAMCLHLLLSYEGHRSGLRTENSLGGFIGMSGWLPFAKHVQRILHPQHSEDEHEDKDHHNPFANSDPESDQSALSISVQVCNYIRDNMDLPPVTNSNQVACLTIPVFLGHGTNDNVVTIAKGRHAAELLKTLGVHDVRWKEYDEGHWYKMPEELDDIVDFLQSRLT